MIVEVKTKRFIACPREGCCGVFWIEHLFEDRWYAAGREFGPWYCDADHCDVVITRGKVTVDGVDVVFGKREHKRGLALLKFGDALLIYKKLRLHDQSNIDSYDYFFHSHQYPTNLIREALDVRIGGRRDIHGQIRYIASVEDIPEIRDKLDTVDSLDDLFAVFGTDGTLPPTRWPLENEGLIPQLAELRRRTIQADGAPLHDKEDN